MQIKTVTSLNSSIIIKLRKQLFSAWAISIRDYNENEFRKIDVQITRLRHKIEKNPKQPMYIKTIRGKGYKLICN